jgi:hypothetical protein
MLVVCKCVFKYRCASIEPHLTIRQINGSGHNRLLFLHSSFTGFPPHLGDFKGNVGGLVISEEMQSRQG